MVRGCWSSALTMTSVSPTPSSLKKHTTLCCGCTLDLLTGTNWTDDQKKIPRLCTFYSHRADCETDHSLVMGKSSVQMKRFKCCRPKRAPCINISHSGNSATTKQFLISLRNTPPNTRQLSSDTQVASDTGNTKSMFEGIKKAIGPSVI